MCVTSASLSTSLLNSSLMASPTCFTWIHCHQIFLVKRSSLHQHRWRKFNYNVKWCQCYVIFFLFADDCGQISQSVCPSHNLIIQSYICKAGLVANQSKAPLRFFTLGQAPGLTRKHNTRLLKPAMDKHCGLFAQTFNDQTKCHQLSQILWRSKLDRLSVPSVFSKHEQNDTFQM